MEIRLHGRGGQGGVTCAKILAATHAELGMSVQAFGDYAGERSGAPVRAYVRVSDRPITDRNKVYAPDHLIVLDATLLADDTVQGLKPGGTLLLNTPDSPEPFASRFPAFRIATVDATSIARKHRIGTRSVVIVNTTITGAFARLANIGIETLESTYRRLGFASNFDAARDAFDGVRVLDVRPDNTEIDAHSGVRVDAARAPVLPLTAHIASPPTGLATGAWRTITPRYTTNLAPCTAWCPAGNDVIGFVRAVSRDGELAAASLLAKTTPFPGVCGRVCPAPCMEGCNRREYDGAVDIRGLERWIADHARPAPTATPRRADAKTIAIVGSGPAGMTAAHHVASYGHVAVVFERERAPGGVLRTGIPSYRLPRTALDAELGRILEMGVEVRCNETIDAARLVSLSRDFDAVILATGLQRLTRLDVDGVSLTGIEQGIHFLHRVNMQGPAPLSGHVVVLGGGNTAMDCARSALRVGAERVTIAYRRTRLEMPANRDEIEEAEHEGISFVFQRQPVGFVGADRVRGVVLATVAMGEPDPAGRRRPIVTGETSELPCDTVLLALGQSSDLSILPSGLELRDGRVVDRGTALAIFAAGDLSTADGTVTHAIGDGRRTAERALAALGVDVTPWARPNKDDAVAATDIRFDHFERKEPARPSLASAHDRVHDFEEVNRGLARSEEAARCFSCGHCTKCDTCLVYCPEGIIRRLAANGAYEIDYTYCKGCGICVAECPRCAMEMNDACPSN